MPRWWLPRVRTAWHCALWQWQRNMAYSSPKTDRWARGLYEAVDLDQEIPDRFYQPVAEVLAFVYSLKKKELK